MNSINNIQKVLIANRGEIACRVIQTLHRLGKTAIAVYSDIDEKALHVEMADQAVCIGGAEPASSYLSIDNIIKAAKESAAEAVYPGYGFLSENPAFAQACADAGLIFIGPSPDVIQKMALKDQAKLIAEQAEVPVQKAISVADQSEEELAQLAEEIGYPILVKAVAGGGGKGMKRVDHPDQFSPSFAAAKRESQLAFGDDQIMIEKYITKARHIEVQIIADSHGNCLHLFERDCSIQRRYQKVVEESPAPEISQELRTALGNAAVNLSKSVNYTGAGTIEFLVDAGAEDLTKAFYFMEMNTRLQVEHPVTEMVTGLDLVEWQVRIAEGEALSFTQDDVSINGHAIEARLYAENPAKNFMPATGALKTLIWPKAEDPIRIDTGVRQGDDVTIYYDPLIAKVIGWGKDRASAAEKISQSLASIQIAGMENNLAFLTSIVTHPDFRAAKVNTGFIGDHFDQLTSPVNALPEAVFIIAGLYLSEIAKSDSTEPDTQKSSWSRIGRWQLNIAPADIFAMEMAEDEHPFIIKMVYDQEQTEIQFPMGNTTLSSYEIKGGKIKASTANGDIMGSAGKNGDTITIAYDDRIFELRSVSPDEVNYEHEHFSGSLTAPLPGKVTRIEMKAGDQVKEGQDIVVLESMKMECALTAPIDGIIDQVLVEIDDTVEEGAEIVVLTPLDQTG